MKLKNWNDLTTNIRNEYDQLRDFIPKTPNRPWDDIVNNVFNAKTYHLEKTDTGWLLDVLVTGYNKEELSITVEGTYILIDGKKQQPIKNGFVSNELSLNINVGNFDAEETEAELKNGLLTLFLPYKEKNKHKISIK